MCKRILICLLVAIAIVASHGCAGNIKATTILARCCEKVSIVMWNDQRPYVVIVDANGIACHASWNTNKGEFDQYKAYKLRDADTDLVFEAASKLEQQRTGGFASPPDSIDSFIVFDSLDGNVHVLAWDEKIRPWWGIAVVNNNQQSEILQSINNWYVIKYRIAAAVSGASSHECVHESLKESDFFDTTDRLRSRIQRAMKNIALLQSMRNGSQQPIDQEPE